MNRLFPTTPLNDAIKRMADGDTGAASVIAMINRERPQNIMAYLNSLDRMKIYGHAIYDLYWTECSGNFEALVSKLSLK